MLYINFFSEGGASLEPVPRGDAWIPVQLPADAEAVIVGLLIGDEIAAALARLFLAGATAGEQAVRSGCRCNGPFLNATARIASGCKMVVVRTA